MSSPDATGRVFKLTKETEVQFSYEPQPDLAQSALPPHLPLVDSLSMHRAAMARLAELLAHHTHAIVSGPPDSGKSELIRHFCAQQGLPLYILHPAKLYAASGDMDSEKKLSRAFQEALALGQKAVLLIQNMAGRPTHTRT